jgi:hypothetical protein
MILKITRSLKIFYIFLTIAGLSSAFYMEFILIDGPDSDFSIQFMKQYIQEGSYLPDVELIKDVLSFLFNTVRTQ